MTNEEAIKIHVLKLLDKCPRLTSEMQARITWEALAENHPNVVEAKRRVENIRRAR